MRRSSLILAATFVATLAAACAQTPGGAGGAQPGQRMTAAQARAFLADSFLTCEQADGGRWMRSFAADGSGYLYREGATIEGGWRAAPDGRVCMSRADTGAETCHAISAAAQGVTLTDDKGAAVACVAG